MKKTVFILATWISSICTLKGQEQEVVTDCQTVLGNAEIEFNAGRFFSVPSMLNSCIERDQFSDELKVRVYELLTQVYLLMDDPAKAEESYLKLLDADPEFIATPEKDPIDVVYLSKKFTTTPIFTPHFRIGGNLSTQSLISEVSTSGASNIARKNTALPGWTGGGGLEWNVTERFGVGAEILVSYKSFKTRRSFINDDDFLNTVQKQNWVDVPVYLRYGDHLGTFRPYAYIGYALNILWRNKLQQSYVDVTPGEGTQQSVEGPDENVLFKRNIFNRSLVMGAGIKYKVGKNFITMDARYMAGHTNITRKDRVYYNDAISKSGNAKDYLLDEMITRYSNAPDFFRVNNWSFSMGYVMPLYHPRRIKNVRTKSVSRELNK